MPRDDQLNRLERKIDTVIWLTVVMLVLLIGHISPLLFVMGVVVSVTVGILLRVSERFRAVFPKLAFKIGSSVGRLFGLHRSDPPRSEP